VRIPVCVVRFIRSICPSDDDQYTGQIDGEGEGGDNNNNEEEDDLINPSFHEIEEEASRKIVHFDWAKAFVCHCISRVASTGPSTSIKLFLNLQLKDGRSLTIRNYFPQSRTSAKTNAPIRHCACFALEKQRIVLSSQVPLSMRTIK
jgi:hypothetical protein